MRWKRKSDCASDVFVVHLAGVKTFLLFFSRFIDKSDINAWIGKIIHIIFIIFCCFKEIRYIFWLPIHHYHLMQYRMETKKNDTNKQCRERKKYKNKQPTRIKNLYSRWMEMRWRWDENYEKIWARYKTYDWKSHNKFNLRRTYAWKTIFKTTEVATKREKKQTIKKQRYRCWIGCKIRFK